MLCIDVDKKFNDIRNLYTILFIQKLFQVGKLDTFLSPKFS